MTHLFAFFTVVLALLFSPSPGFAQDDFDATFAAGVESLQTGEFEQGLASLERADELGHDPRIVYYQGYALEKLGRCAEAKKAYRRATRQDYPEPRMREAAASAFDGVEERCQPAHVELSETPGEPKRRLGTGRVGWKIFGWSATAIGSLTLLAIPLKTSAEQDVANEAEQYFELRYGCEVERGAASGEACRFDELSEDEVYVEYSAALDQARRSTTLLMVGGAGLAAAGILTLVIVASTRGKSKVAIRPRHNGLSLSISF